MEVGASRGKARPIALVVIALAALPLACSTTGDDDGTDADQARSTPVPAEEEQPLSADEEHGRELFVDTCGSCHTLDAAGTQGSIGPNLDEAQVDEADVLKAIETGGTGSGNMPAGLLSGQDAADVAAFVAASGPAP